MLSRTLCRAATAAVRPALARAAVRPAAARALPSTLRTFSTSFARFEPTALSTKLGEELQFERDNADLAAEPDFLAAFKAEGVVDEEGSDEIVLTRTFGSEQIRLIFSISDLDAEQDLPEAFQDEEAADAGSGGLGDEAVGASETSFPLETSITITKPSGGAMTIDAIAQDGLFTINNIAFYPDADLALGMSSEDDWKRQGLYMGPAFDNLDEGVQSEFETYLEERGVNSALALFIPDLAEWKEQKEYVRWLEGTKTFLEQ
ncbi:Mitochondrial acidic protein mam33 [Rhodotorula mucilaginosa]|uniref:Mitochondrial acidic protein mam33 n=1 Tax=Rhodotorula mucilaginosa TaxID=5537 RepID=A0A9P7B446_RHOMI|nr:Mitochondrial acidic protein mam33 [Rhodotorula mucilaginosa]